MRLLAALPVFAVLLATGCTASSPEKQPGDATRTPLTYEASAYDNAIAGIKPDGTVDAPTAVAAFTVAIGQLPGVPAPTGPRRQIRSGTSAVRWVSRHWQALTPAQRNAAQTALAGGLGGSGGGLPMARTAVQKAPGRNPSANCHRTDTASAAPFRPLLDKALTDLTGVLKYTMRSKPALVVNVATLEGDSIAYAVDCGGSAAKPGCTIHLNPKAVREPYDVNSLRATLVHEAMHCIVYDKFPGKSNTPDWLDEGLGSYAEISVGKVSDDVADHYWQRYLASDALTLFQRSYDAVGFFAFLEHNGVDVWSRVFAMYQAYFTGGNVAAWNAAGVTEPILDNWGSSYAMGSRAGREWTIEGTGAPEQGPQLVTQIVRNGDVHKYGVAEVSTRLERFQFAADVVQFSPVAGTHGRLGPDGGSDRTVPSLAGVNFCTKPGGCACPEGTANSGATFETLPNSAYLGITGALKVGMVHIAGVSLEEFCKKKDPCIVGEWRGDAMKVTGAGLSGGGVAGSLLSIDKTGAYRWNLEPSEKLTLTGPSLSAQARYHGSMTGAVAIDSVKEDKGNWAPKKAAIGGIAVSLTMLSPIRGQILNRAPLAKLAGKFGAAGQIPGAVTARYSCTETTLTLTLTNGMATWPFTRI